jgi:KDO2-lipid IV(A) lauroyltransferase
MKYKYRRYFLYYLGRSAAFFVGLLPLSVSYVLAVFLGRCAYYILHKYRKIALENLSQAFGREKTELEIVLIAKKVFENLAKNAVELLNFPKMNARNIDRFVTIEGIERIDDSFARGRGTIVLAFHFGNWDLTGLVFRLKGYPGATIGKKIYFYKYDEWLNSLRRAGDVNVIYRDDSPRKMLKVLKENKILGVVADQDVDSVDGVFVDFFGRPAYTPVGPVVLAKATGASMIPVLVVRDGTRHRFIIEKPVELVDTGDKEADIVTNTKRWSDVIESYIRKYPDQWVWMHRRWKTQREGQQSIAHSR